MLPELPSLADCPGCRDGGCHEQEAADDTRESIRLVNVSRAWPFATWALRSGDAWVDLGGEG